MPRGYDFQYRTPRRSIVDWWTTELATTSPASGGPTTTSPAAGPTSPAAGLTAAFADIASKIKSYTTSFSTSLPQVAVAGNASYSSQFDSSELEGRDQGERAELRRQRHPAAGREVELLEPSGGAARGHRLEQQPPHRDLEHPDPRAGVPFRATSLSATQLAALDTAYATRQRQHRVRQLPARRSEQRDPLHRGRQQQGVSKPQRPHRRHRRLEGPAGRTHRRSPTPTPRTRAMRTFKQTWASRPTVVYVGANDGMLHAINGSLALPAGGVEMFAYVPGALYQGPNCDPGRSTASRRSAARRSRTATSSTRPRTSTTSTSGARPTAPGRPRRGRRTGARS